MTPSNLTNKFTSRSSVTGLLALTLTACGGGGDPESQDNTSPTTINDIKTAFTQGCNHTPQFTLDDYQKAFSEAHQASKLIIMDSPIAEQGTVSVPKDGVLVVTGTIFNDDVNIVGAGQFNNPDDSTVIINTISGDNFGMENIGNAVINCSIGEGDAPISAGKDMSLADFNANKAYLAGGNMKIGPNARSEGNNLFAAEGEFTVQSGAVLDKSDALFTDSINAFEFSIACDTFIAGDYPVIRIENRPDYLVAQNGSINFPGCRPPTL